MRLLCLVSFNRISSSYDFSLKNLQRQEVISTLFISNCIEFIYFFKGNGYPLKLFQSDETILLKILSFSRLSVNFLIWHFLIIRIILLTNGIFLKSVKSCNPFIFIFSSAFQMFPNLASFSCFFFRDSSNWNVVNFQSNSGSFDIFF